MSENKDEKGQITADISDKAVAEALASVERVSKGEAAPPAPEPGAEEAAAETSAEMEKLQAVLEDSQRRGREMMEKLRDTHDRMLRAVADLDNFKKRASKEKEDLQKFAVEKLVKELLPVMDNLERALEVAKKSKDVEALLSGVGLVQKLFETVLARFGVEAHTAAGKPFDPALHEALMQQETAEVPANTVVAEMARGYTLHGRLIRPAAVVVSRAPAAEAPPPEPEKPATEGG